MLVFPQKELVVVSRTKADSISSFERSLLGRLFGNRAKRGYVYLHPFKKDITPLAVS